MKLHALLILTALLTSGTGIAGTGAISFPQNGTPLNMDEGGPGQTVTLERTGGSSGSVTVTVAAEPITTGFNRTPVSPTVAVMEYRLPPPGAWTPLYWNEGFPVTFADTVTSASFEIRPIDNNAFEGGFGVEGNLVLKDAAAPAIIGNPPSMSLRISNNDPWPMVLSGSVILPEGNGDTPVLHLIHIVLDRPVAGFPATPFLRVLPRGGDSAREGVDYRFPGGGYPTDWVQYGSSFTIPIEIIPDSVYEGDESLGDPGGSYFFDFGAGHYVSPPLITIQDDDPAPVLSIAPASVSVVEGNSGTTVLNFTVSLDAPVTVPVRFFWSMINSGTAAYGEEFTGEPDWVSIPAGSLSAALSVSIHGDTAYEPDESFEVQISQPTGAILGTDKALVTILNDDRAPVLSIASASVAEGNAGTTALHFTVSLDAPATAPVSFYWSTRLQLWPPGRFASEGTDFTGVGGSVVMPAGSLSTSLSVTVHGDTAYELDETFEVYIYDAAGAILGTGTALATILNDDAAPVLIMGAPGAISLVEPDSPSDSSTFTDVSFSLSSSAGQGLTRQVSYSITAPEGTVISPASGTLSFPTNEPVNLRLYVRGDTIPEFNAPVTITFSNPQNLQLTQTAAPLFTVIDNDKYGVLISSPSVTEGHSGGSTLRYSVSLTAPALRDIGLNYFTSHGTANSADYTAASGTLTIGAGLTAATVDVTVLGDTLVETDETILLNVSSTDVLVAPGTVSAPGTILFDDYGSPPAPAGTLVTEIESGPELLAWFSVAMPASVVPVTCRVSTRDGTATAADNDYRALGNAPLTFAPGETSKWVAVAVTAASKEEAREQFFLDVQHSVTGAVRSAPCTIERLSITQFWRPFPQFFAMRFPTGLGQRYVVYEAASLTGPWTPSSSILTGTGFPVTQTMFSEFDLGFFRVQTAPPLPPGTAAVGP